MRMDNERPRRASAGALLLLCLAACGADTTTEDGPAHVAFTVRGRMPDVDPVTYAIEETGGPLAADVFEREIEAALAAWRDAGPVRFERGELGSADVTFGWRSGAHDACPSFGADARIAHTGPTTPGTFVHFDAARAWVPRADEGESLYHTALHEIGHALGLGHSGDPGAVLNAEYANAPAVPSLSDRAALASLYGGELDPAPGDLVIAGDVALRHVAPVGVSDYALLDVDGNGADEVLVWRTDRGGGGALMIYAFAPGPELLSTAGPLWGAVAPGAEVRVGEAVGGERVIVSVYDNGREVARALEETGALRLVTEPVEWRVVASRSQGDVDGDGEKEQVSRRAAR
ncbi:MAG: matrixin family metalloprotease [bacterium]|nr:matrixin family metalloprotease [bacterium]